MPASRARKLSQLMSEGGSLDTQIDSGGTTSEIGGGGVTIYATTNDLPLTGNTSGDMAFVSGSRHFYVHDGNGWYSVALVNESPSAITGVDTSYTLATDGTPTVVTATSTDPEGMPLTWSYAVTSGSLGTTATVLQGTGANTNQFTVTPGTNDSTDEGTFDLTFSATDGVNTVTKTSTFNLQFAFSSIAAAYTANAADGLQLFSIPNVNNSQPFYARYASYDGKGWIEILFSEVGDRSHHRGGSNGGNYVASEEWAPSSTPSGWDNTKSSAIGYMRSHRNTIATMGPNATTTGGLDYTASSSFMMLGPNINATDVAFTTKNSKTGNGLAATGANQNNKYPVITSTGTNDTTTTTKMKDYFTGNGEGFFVYGGWTGMSPSLGIVMATRDNTTRDTNHWGPVTGETTGGTYYMNYGYRDGGSYQSYHVGNWEASTGTHPYIISSTNVMSIWISDG